MTSSNIAIEQLADCILENTLKARHLRAETKRAGLEAAQYPVGSDAYWEARLPGSLARRERTRHLRWNARYVYLAYGFLRNRTYRQIEPKVGEDNEPAASGILAEMRRAGYPIKDDELVFNWLDRGDVRLIEMTAREAA